jgi:hypothetical protein
LAQIGASNSFIVSRMFSSPMMRQIVTKIQLRDSRGYSRAYFAAYRSLLSSE